MNKTEMNVSAEMYVKPTMEIIEMEIEGAILNGSGRSSDYSTDDDENW